MPAQNTNPETVRLREAHNPNTPWKKWGPYLAERQWGTVREDYSQDGDAWNYFTHDQARSRAYHWGEDGLAGISDEKQLLCFSVALWNGKDPILKERMFGLTNSEANHGEDVKEYYFYLDSTPTHSYMKYLYKYPQAAFPYSKLIEENGRRRGQQQSEYELIDTGVFDHNRYFDVFVEYAKAAPDDICIRIEVANRGPEEAEIHVLPQIWFRNRGSWGKEARPEPAIRLRPSGKNFKSLEADDSLAEAMPNLSYEYRLGKRYLYCDADGQPLFTDNETNAPRVWGAGAQSRSPFVKDAFHRYVIGNEQCVNPEQVGTKACLHYAARNVPAGGSIVISLRLTNKVLKQP